ncbi:MAG: c-type cytochrome [Parvibaculum sp.]|uniref:c-type cytochrome n=1 Tax=Parvibaculum sp. TaxID=2024848 RepID=UPI003C74EB43
MRIGRIALWSGAAVAALAAIGLLAVFVVFPRVSAAPDLEIEATPELVARGDYLFNHELACTGCHTPEIEPHRYSRVFDKARIAAGRHMGGVPAFPTEVNAPNLTPAALGDWTDGEIYRAIVSGVDRTGRPLFPVMPYPFYRSLDPEDVKAVIAYLRTLPPEPVTLAPVELPMPLPIFMRLVPADPTPQSRPDPKDEVAYGKYLAFAGSCFECHTKRNERGEPVGTPFAGGNEFPIPGGGVARSANITPDEETGIGGWSREAFIARFRNMSPESADKITPGPQDVDTEMPWTAYSGMKDEDLGAIYAYLRTVAPAKGKIDTFSPPAEEAAR